MKKRYGMTVLGIISSSILASVIFRNKGFKNRMMQKEKVSQADILNDAGIPDQIDKGNDKAKIDQIENAEMVSEGSQYGVNYYNEARAEMDEKMKQ